MGRSLIAVIKKLATPAVKWRAMASEGRVLILKAKYRCSVCNMRVEGFEALPEFYLENLEKHGWPYTGDEAETCNFRAYQCPYCKSSDRDRLYALYLHHYLTQLKPNTSLSIVDFAPSAPLSDFIRRQIMRARSNISYRTADAFADGADDRVDITNMHLYEDARFDFFLCSHVLEHVADDQTALRELRRILKPGGKGILMVPIILGLVEIDEDPTVVDEGERWRRFGQYDHVRLYSKKGFVDRVQAAGFTLSEYGNEFFGKESFARHGITDQSVLYVVEK